MLTQLKIAQDAIKRFDQLKDVLIDVKLDGALYFFIELLDLQRILEEQQAYLKKSEKYKSTSQDEIITIDTQSQNLKVRMQSIQDTITTIKIKLNIFGNDKNSLLQKCLEKADTQEIIKINQIVEHFGFKSSESKAQKRLSTVFGLADNLVDIIPQTSHPDDPDFYRTSQIGKILKDCATHTAPIYREIEALLHAVSNFRNTTRVDSWVTKHLLKKGINENKIREASEALEKALKTAESSLSKKTGKESEIFRKAIDYAKRSRELRLEHLKKKPKESGKIIEEAPELKPILQEESKPADFYDLSKDFKVIRGLGEGRFGIVKLYEYNGGDPYILSLCDSKKRIVIKFLKEENETELNKFKKEQEVADHLYSKADKQNPAYALARSGSILDENNKIRPAIFGQFEYFEDDLQKRPSGKTVENFLDELSNGEVADLDIMLVQLASSIEASIYAMHAAGVYHLDPNPGNFLIKKPDGIHFTAIATDYGYSLKMDIERGLLSEKDVNRDNIYPTPFMNSQTLQYLDEGYRSPSDDAYGVKVAFLMMVSILFKEGMNKFTALTVNGELVPFTQENFLKFIMARKGCTDEEALNSYLKQAQAFLEEKVNTEEDLATIEKCEKALNFLKSHGAYITYISEDGYPEDVDNIKGYEAAVLKQKENNHNKMIESNEKFVAEKIKVLLTPETIMTSELLLSLQRLKQIPVSATFKQTTEYKLLEEKLLPKVMLRTLTQYLADNSTLATLERVVLVSKALNLLEQKNIGNNNITLDHFRYDPVTRTLSMPGFKSLGETESKTEIYNGDFISQILGKPHQKLGNITAEKKFFEEAERLSKQDTMLKGLVTEINMFLRDFANPLLKSNIKKLFLDHMPNITGLDFTQQEFEEKLNRMYEFSGKVKRITDNNTDPYVQTKEIIKLVESYPDFFADAYFINEFGLALVKEFPNAAQANQDLTGIQGLAKIGLAGYLIKPIQWLLKYPTHLAGLLKVTTDQEKIKETTELLTKFKELADKNNEMVRGIERVQNLQNLMGGHGKSSTVSSNDINDALEELSEPLVKYAANPASFTPEEKVSLRDNIDEVIYLLVQKISGKAEKDKLSETEVADLKAMFSNLSSLIYFAQEVRGNPLYFPSDETKQLLMAIPVLVTKAPTIKLDIEKSLKSFLATEKVVLYFKNQEKSMNEILEKLEADPNFKNVFAEYFKPRNYREFFKSSAISYLRETEAYIKADQEIKEEMVNAKTEELIREAESWTFKDIMIHAYEVGLEGKGGQAGTTRNQAAYKALEAYLAAHTPANSAQEKLIHALVNARASLCFALPSFLKLNSEFLGNINNLIELADNLDTTVNMQFAGPRKSLEGYIKGMKVFVAELSAFDNISQETSEKLLRELPQQEVKATFTPIDTQKVNQSLAKDLSELWSLVPKGGADKYGVQTVTINKTDVSEELQKTLPFGTDGKIVVKVFAEGAYNRTKTEDALERVKFLADVAKFIKPEKSNKINKILEKYKKEVEEKCQIKIKDRFPVDFERIANEAEKIFKAMQKELMLEIDVDSKVFKAKADDYIIQKGRPTIVQFMPDGTISAHIPKGEKTYPSTYRGSTEEGVNPNSVFEITARKDKNNNITVEGTGSRAVSFSVLKFKGEEVERAKLNLANAKEDIQDLLLMLDKKGGLSNGQTLKLSSTSLLTPLRKETHIERFLKFFRKKYKSETKQLRDHHFALEMLSGEEFVINGKKVKVEIDHMNISVKDPKKFKTKFISKKKQAEMNNRGFAHFQSNQLMLLKKAFPHDESLNQVSPLITPIIMRKEKELSKKYKALRQACEDGNSKEYDKLKKEIITIEKALSKLYEKAKPKFLAEPNNINVYRKDPTTRAEKQRIYFLEAQRIFYNGYTKEGYAGKLEGFLFAAMKIRANQLAGIPEAWNCKSSKDRSEWVINIVNVLIKFEQDKGYPMTFEDLKNKDIKDHYFGKVLKDMHEYGASLEAINQNNPGGRGNRMNDPSGYDKSNVDKLTNHDAWQKLDVSIYDIERKLRKIIKGKSVSIEDVDDILGAMPQEMPENPLTGVLSPFEKIKNPILRRAIVVRLISLVEKLDHPIKLPKDIDARINQINSLFAGSDDTETFNEKYIQFLGIVGPIMGLSDLKKEFVISLISAKDLPEIKIFDQEFKTAKDYTSWNLLNSEINNELRKVDEYLFYLNSAIGFLKTFDAPQAEKLQNRADEMLGIKVLLGRKSDELEHKMKKHAKKIESELDQASKKSVSEEMFSVKKTGVPESKDDQKVEKIWVLDKKNNFAETKNKEVPEDSTVIIEYKSKITYKPAPKTNEAVDLLAIQRAVNMAFEKFKPVTSVDDLKFTGNKEMVGIAKEYAEDKLVKQMVKLASEIGEDFMPSEKEQKKEEKNPLLRSSHGKLIKGKN